QSGGVEAPRNEFGHCAKPFRGKISFKRAELDGVFPSRLVERFEHVDLVQDEAMEKIAVAQARAAMPQTKDPFVVRREMIFVGKRGNRLNTRKLSALRSIFGRSHPNVIATLLDSPRAARAGVNNFGFFFGVPGRREADYERCNQHDGRERILVHRSLGNRRIFKISTSKLLGVSRKRRRSPTANMVSPLQSPEAQYSDASRSITPSLLTLLT